jgi:hypothetical protein
MKCRSGAVQGWQYFGAVPTASGRTPRLVDHRAGREVRFSPTNVIGTSRGSPKGASGQALNNYMFFPLSQHIAKLHSFLERQGCQGRLRMF